MDHFGKAPTKFGVCASNCAQYNAIACLLFGYAGVLSVTQGDPPQEQIEATTGAYAMYAAHGSSV